MSFARGWLCLYLSGLFPIQTFQKATPEQKAVSASVPRGGTREVHGEWSSKTLCCCCCVTLVFSDSVWPQRRQPTRLLCPWDSPGKNTGVGCHLLFQCMEVKSESEVPQSCPTLSDLMDCSLPGSSAHGVFQARVLERGATAFSTKTLYLEQFFKFLLRLSFTAGLDSQQNWEEGLEISYISPTLIHE